MYSLIEDFWLRNTLNIPKWFRASRDIVLVSPSSCAIGPASPFSFDIDSLHSQGFSDSQAAAVRFVIIVIFVCLLIINFSYEILKEKKLKLSIFELVQLLVIWVTRFGSVYQMQFIDVIHTTGISLVQLITLNKNETRSRYFFIKKAPGADAASNKTKNAFMK